MLTRVQDIILGLLHYGIWKLEMENWKFMKTAFEQASIEWSWKEISIQPSSVFIGVGTQMKIRKKNEERRKILHDDHTT